MARTRDLLDDAIGGFNASTHHAQTTSNAFNAFRSTPEPDNSANPVDVTNFTDKDFHVDAAPVQMDSVAMAGAEATDVSAQQASLDAVETDYMNTNDLITNTIFAQAMMEVHGRADGAQMMGQLLPDGGVTKIQAAVSMVDPTGVVGSVWATIDAVYSENKNVAPGALQEAVSATLDKLQAQEQYQKMTAEEQAMAGPPPLDITIPQGISFEGVNAQQMLGFLQRDVDNDRVMQDIALARTALDDVEQNNKLIASQDHVLGDQHAKAVFAAAHGDVERVSLHTADLTKEVAITNGVDELEATQILAEKGVADASFTHDSARGVLAGGYSEVPLPVREGDAITVSPMIKALLDDGEDLDTVYKIADPRIAGPANPLMSV